MTRTISIRTPGRGLHDITSQIRAAVHEWWASGVGVGVGGSGSERGGDGLCTLFIRHTSASLIIQENADPSARRDLERWFDRHVPDADAATIRREGYTHTAEGPDDMPSHIRAALTAVSLSIPIQQGRLMLGTWQGVYLFEHRASPHTREVVIHIGA